MPGMRILVVEDSPVTATATEDWLTAQGHQPVGPAFRLSTALTLVDAVELEGALVDLNIRGEKSYPVMERLAARGVPFIITSGYAYSQLPDQWQDRPRLPKPYTEAALANAVASLFA